MVKIKRTMILSTFTSYSLSFIVFTTFFREILQMWNSIFMTEYTPLPVLLYTVKLQCFILKLFSNEPASFQSKLVFQYLKITLIAFKHV